MGVWMAELNEVDYFVLARGCYNVAGLVRLVFTGQVAWPVMTGK